VARGRGAARGRDDGARRLVEEQHVLERLLDDAKPPVPAAAAHLHWLLFTPFRYPPPPGGSRFRGPNDPGVFYGADAIGRRARSSATGAGVICRIPRAFGDADASANGLPGEARHRRRRPPREAVRAGSAALDRSRRLFALPGVGRTAREAKVGAIRYESVRDPNASVLRGALAGRVRSSTADRAADVDAVGRAGSRHLQRTHALTSEEHEFVTAEWTPQRTTPTIAIRALGRTEYEPTWRAMQSFTSARTSARPTRSG
jgi:hypothetical protein